MGKTHRYKKHDWDYSGPTKKERAETREEKVRQKREKRRSEKEKLRKSFKKYMEENRQC